MKIVVLDGYTVNPGDNPWAETFRKHELFVHDRCQPEEVHGLARGATVILTNKVAVSEMDMASLPDLKLILVMATGYDFVDTQAARRRGITVCNAPGYSAPAVAELTFALLLALCRRAEFHHQQLVAGDRGPGPDFCFWRTPQVELAGQTMGLVGYGQIGQRVARIAQAMDLRVLVTSRHRRETLGIEWTSLDDMLARSQIVSLHCPLTAESKHLVNEGFLAKMQPGSILLNTARGGLVVEEDLLAALISGQLRAAGLDTLAQEPVSAGHPLLSHPNCLVTPHIAWTTLAARQRLMAILASNLQAFLAGEPQHMVSG